MLKETENYWYWCIAGIQSVNRNDKETYLFVKKGSEITLLKIKIPNPFPEGCTMRIWFAFLEVRNRATPCINKYINPLLNTPKLH